MSIEKTHEEIVAEMRNRTDLDGGDMVDNFSLDACFGEYGGWDSLMLIKAYADILEAAHKRDIDRELDKLWKRIGNKTKLREAVERCLAVLKRIDWLGDGVFPNGKFVSPELLARAIQEAEAALAEPARNCDRYNDATKAMAELKRRHHECAEDSHPCREDCPDCGKQKCAIAWLFAKEESEVAK